MSLELIKQNITATIEGKQQFVNTQTARLPTIEDPDEQEKLAILCSAVQCNIDDLVKIRNDLINCGI